MPYNGIKLEQSINIDKLYTVHYFEYMSDFAFKGESHDFWEFISVDKGEVEITCGTETHILKKGDIVFHEPGEFHDVKACGGSTPNLVVISFGCNDSAMDFYRKRFLQIDETGRNLLANIIIEARRCFNCRLDDPYLQNMPRGDSDMFGSEQLIKLYLEHFLIHLIRRYSAPVVIRKKLPKAKFIKTTKNRNDTAVFNRIVDYCESNLTSRITIEQICRDNLIGRSQLQKIMKERTGFGVIDYFSHMKINAAKEMIRASHMNFTQIAEYLGYTSVHYFSRQFKKIEGMTPSDYASSIKAVSEGRTD